MKENNKKKEIQELMKKKDIWNIKRLVDESFVPANQHIIS